MSESNVTAPVVPASEFDALCDAVAAMADELFIDPVDATAAVGRALGEDARAWMGRILIDGERAHELFGSVPSDGGERAS